MAKLSLAMAAAIALASAQAPAAPPATAEEALARQQASLRSSLSLGCDRDAGEIVVCGRQGPDPNRLPLPVEPEPGARVAGEPSDPKASLALTNQKCTTVGPNQQCSGGLPILGIALFLVHTAVKAAMEEE
ncbi:MAG TPA: hypothetical protein VD846_02150 [Allosphingosinicella sp.]|nr:hypothetical protein [Allosphingosinicella sp.]